MSEKDGKGKPTSVGVQGTKVTFSIGGTNYITGSVAPAQASSMSAQQAQALVDSGAAQPLSDTYLSQFPWTTPPK